MFAVDIYRIIKLCGMLVGLWIVYFFGLSAFRSGVTAKPPRYNVVDFEKVGFAKEFEKKS